MDIKGFTSRTMKKMLDYIIWHSLLWNMIQATTQKLISNLNWIQIDIKTRMEAILILMLVFKVYIKLIVQGLCLRKKLLLKLIRGYSMLMISWIWISIRGFCLQSANISHFWMFILDLAFWEPGLDCNNINSRIFTVVMIKLR